MKRFLIIPLMAGLFFFQGCGVLLESSAEKTARLEREAIQVRESVEAEDFKVDISFMIPFGMPSRSVTNYSVKVKDSHIVSYLPYVGRAWDVPYGGGHALNFEADIQESDVYRDSDGNYTVRLLVRTDEDSHVYTFEIYANGNTNLLVQSKNREPINYRGKLLFDEE